MKTKFLSGAVAIIALIATTTFETSAQHRYRCAKARVAVCTRPAVVVRTPAVRICAPVAGFAARPACRAPRRIVYRTPARRVRRVRQYARCGKPVAYNNRYNHRQTRR